MSAVNASNPWSHDTLMQRGGLLLHQLTTSGTPEHQVAWNACASVILYLVHDQDRHRDHQDALHVAEFVIGNVRNCYVPGSNNKRFISLVTATPITDRWILDAIYAEDSLVSVYASMTKNQSDARFRSERDGAPTHFFRFLRTGCIRLRTRLPELLWKNWNDFYADFGPMTL